MIAGWDILIALAGLVIAMAALLPFVPAWAWYAFAVAFTFTRILEILEHGLTTKRAVVVITSMPILIFGWFWLRRQKREGGKP